MAQDKKTSASPAVTKGYAFFDKDGKLIGKSVSTADSVVTLDLPAGVCYLKVVGSGLIDPVIRRSNLPSPVSILL